ncbi:MAG: murein biosynthesis integral membrane protein MurJ [Syntrophomonadaceae bacterium]|nr:murein biosynthesis integral membrane protein MurJ [Syntrophomonadaceae bacterium]
MTAKRFMVKAAGFMMVATLLARFLGLARDMVFYSWFGRSHVTDAYLAAFSIPDLIYMLLVGGALSSAFIPVFSSYLARNQEEEGWKVTSIVFNYAMLLMLVLITLGEIFTRPLMIMLVPDLPPEQITLAVSLTRVMLLQTVFMTLSGIALGILNSKQHFSTPAIGSILYNVGIIVVGMCLAREIGIMAFSIGVVVGSVLNLAVQIPALLKAGMRYYPSFNLRHPGFKQIMILMVPILLGLSISQINLLVTQNLASGLAEGSISALRLAQRLMQLPIGIFGIPIAMAVFPSMNLQVVRNEINDFKRTFSLGLRAIFLITIPASVGLLALREPIIGLLFQQGRFTASDTVSTGLVLAFYCIGLFAYSAIPLLNRVFYSLQDTITPVVIGGASVVLNIGFAVMLVGSIEERGLALAYSLAGVLNVVMLLGILKLRLGTIDGYKITRSLVIASGASGVMYMAVNFVTAHTRALSTLAPKINELVTVTAGIGAGVVVYSLIILLFRLEEARLVLDLIKKRLPGLNG